MRRYLIIGIVFLMHNLVWAQVDFPRISPKATASQTVGYTIVTVNYSRPAVNGRKIWGSLVPFEQVWRTGANEATTIQFTTDVIVEGNKVPAGRYSLFTIPSDSEWTIILNKTDQQWGAFNYKKEDDLLRFKTKPVRGPFTERLQFSFSETADSSMAILLNWENIELRFRIGINLARQVRYKIKQAMAENAGDWHVYYASADYAADNGLFLTEALQWCDKAIALDGAYNPYFVKAKVLYKMTRFTDALKSLEKCREAGRSDKNYESFLGQIDFLEKQIRSKMK